MLKNLLSVVLLFSLFVVQGQDPLNMELLSNVQFNESGNDIWGFVDAAGTEYAVIGTRTATRIYSLEDPRNPIERYVVSGAASTWRDIKYYNGYLYVTTDTGQDGLTIINATMAPDSFSFVRWQPTLDLPNGSGTLERTHNLYIDTDTGIMYLAGHNISRRGIMICDIKEDPNVPVVLSSIDEVYSHDAYVKDGKLFSSEVLVGDLAIYDVSDPTNPIELTRQQTSRAFCHNAWATDDNAYVFTTDERNSAYMDSYDVRKDGEAIFLDKFRSLETIDLPVIPHNTHVLGDYAITSWYTDGVVVTDISHPDNIIKVGQYDTFTDEDSLNQNGGGQWFSGAWGAYPYLPSGVVLVSDINTGLYVFGIDYKRASFLEGKVTSALPFELGEPIPNARVELLDGQVAYDNTSSTGVYKSGRQEPGMVRVAFSHPSYNSDTLDAEIVAGEVTILDAQLTANFIGFKAQEAGSLAPVNKAKFILEDIETGDFVEYTTDADGVVFAPAISDKEYAVYVAAWGYQNAGPFDVTITEGMNELVVDLEEGYQDFFFADLGWELTATAGTGNWERGVPRGTFFGSTPSNPGEDVSTDIGTSAYVTGNQGLEAGDDDVDNGTTVLTSPPMNMSSWQGAKISYKYWYFNAGGSGTPNDSLNVFLSNGTERIALIKYLDNTTGWSDTEEFDILPSMISFTDNMRLVVEASDIPEGHLVEAAIDEFNAAATMPNNTVDGISTDIQVLPNPAQNFISIQLNDNKANYRIADASGKVVLSGVIHSEDMIDISTIAAGSYFIQINGTKDNVALPFVKM